MAYTRREIKDRVAVGDDIFIVEDLGNNRIRLIPAPTHISEPGTPVNKALLQPIEDYLATGVVPVERRIIAGSGLSGGGSLDADRTLSVKFGTTAGTVCEGNDYRLSNARPPTAHNHDDRYYTKSQLIPIMHYWSLNYWTPRDSGTTSTLRGVAYANGLWVVVGSNGTILTSTNGTSWTSQSSGTTSTLRGVAYGNGLWIVVGTNGVIRTSPDGISWTSSTSGTTKNLHEIVYAEGLWVVMGENGMIMASIDGTTWAPRPSGMEEHLYGIAHADGLWVVVGVGGTIATAQVITP